MLDSKSRLDPVAKLELPGNNRLHHKIAGRAGSCNSCDTTGLSSRDKEELKLNRVLF